MKYSAQAVKAANIFSAKKDIRYYLNGVALYIKDNRIESVAATDGHCLAVVGVIPSQGATPVVVSNENVPTLITALKSVADAPTVTVDHMSLTVGGYTIPLVDGRFPDIRRVIPATKRKPSELIGIQPDYLAKLKPFKAELCRHLTPANRKPIGVKMLCGGADEAVRFEFIDGDHDDALVIIQPIRL